MGLDSSREAGRESQGGSDSPHGPERISQADGPGAQREPGHEPEWPRDLDVAGALGRVVEICELQPAQAALRRQFKRFNVVVCHRGFGKSVLAVNLLIQQAAKKPGSLYAFLTDTYQHAKDIAWDRILKVSLEEAAKLGVVRFHEGDLRVTFLNGSEIKLYGVDTRPEAVRGLHLDGVVFDEAQLIPGSVWEQIVLPALLRKNGGAIFIGTPHGRNDFYTLYKQALQRPDWFTAIVRADESGVFTPEQLELARNAQTPETYAQEMECSFETAISGAYYARELRAARVAGRIRSVEYDPALPVTTWWDLGNIDATAIIFAQFVGREIHIIDYDEGKGLDLATWAKRLQTRPYLYARHHLPHDAEGKHLAAAGRTITDQLRALNVRPITVHPSQDVLHGINQARLLFSRCYFDAVKCERLLDCLAYYHAKVDLKHQVDRPEPEHDWSSHAADAFRYLAIGARSAERAVDDTPRVHTAKMAAEPLRPMQRPKPQGVGVLLRSRAW
jgi:phage terminase large subunit